jgi:hypothetical protein
MLYEENPWLKHIENMEQQSAHHYLPNKESLVKVTMWMSLYFKMEEKLKHWNACLEIRKNKRVYILLGARGSNIGVCISRFWNKKISWKAFLIFDLIIENYSIYTWRHKLCTHINLAFITQNTFWNSHLDAHVPWTYVN